MTEPQSLPTPDAKITLMDAVRNAIEYLRIAQRETEVREEADEIAQTIAVLSRFAEEQITLMNMADLCILHVSDPSVVVGDYAHLHNALLHNR